MQTAGRPDASASRTTKPRVSVSEGIVNISQLANTPLSSSSIVVIVVVVVVSLVVVEVVMVVILAVVQVIVVI